MVPVTGAIPCPYCGKVNDRHSRNPGQEPKDGDVGLCWGCGNPAVFTRVLGQLGQRLPTLVELDEIESQPEFIAAQAAVRAARIPTDAVRALRESGVFE